MQVIKFCNDKKLIKKFIQLPSRLYCRAEKTQNKAVEKQLLTEGHVLSHQFKISGFIVADENGKVLARCIATAYENDDSIYFGFFESINSLPAAKLLLDAVRVHGTQLGKNRITGPVDASFWLGYRLKTDSFSKPFTCEPYNKSYYQQLLQQAGLKICEEYCSNHYRVIEKSHSNQKLESRLERAEAMGYVIKSPKKDEFNAALLQIHKLVTALYADFPAYKPISTQEFTKLFSPLYSVLNFDMVKIAYKNNTPVGFIIAVPDYGALGTITPLKLLHILKVKRKPKGYILLYMGADKTDAGLGSALAQTIKGKLQECGAYSVGALIHSGKVSEGYFKGLVEKTTHYALFSDSL